MGNIYHNFANRLAEPWRLHLVRSGTLHYTGTTLQLAVEAASRWGYTDAQVDDYQFSGPPRLLWQPPLRLTLRARFSHPAGEFIGTAGFGFWNYPVLVSRHHLPTLPRALWFFFGSPPCNMQLDMHTPGYGWKVATLDTQRPDALRLAPFGPLAALAMNMPALYRLLWPRIQRAVGVKEAALHSAMTDWHIYTIEWGTTHTSFRVDGSLVLADAPSPGGPLCFVAWVDNQYAIIKPWGRFGWGLLDIPGRQWLELDWLAIEEG
jgi:hypothetical protein